MINLGVNVSAWSAFLLGIIQGITEWIPVSSQGVVTIVFTWIDGASPSDAIAIALWLHAGTALSAAIALRGEVASIARGSLAAPNRISGPASFLIVSTIVTAAVGLPLYLLAGEVADRFGGVAMMVVGLGMVVTALVIRRRSWEGTRNRDDLRTVDALFVGVAQGLAIIPGLSRTGLTVATLLARGSSHREAVILSVLMGIPSSAGAGLLAATTSGLISGWPAANRTHDSGRRWCSGNPAHSRTGYRHSTCAICRSGGHHRLHGRTDQFLA